MLAPVLLLLYVTHFFAGAQAENANPGEALVSNRRFADRYISAGSRAEGRFGGGPSPKDLRGDPGPGIGYIQNQERRAKFPQPAANSYMQPESWREPNFEWPNYNRFDSEVETEQDRRKPKGFDSKVETEQDRRKTKGPVIPSTFSRDYNRFDKYGEVDIEQDRRKPKGPAIPSAFSRDYNRFGEVDIEQARRKPKGPVIPSAFSRDYNRFDSEVETEQDRRKPKGPVIPSAFSRDYNRFGEVDIEQTRRKPKGPVIPSAFSRDYNRFDSEVETEQDRRKPKGPVLPPSTFSRVYNRFGEVDIEQARRKPKGPIIPSAFSRDYNRFDSEVETEQDRRKPKGPVIPSTFSRVYNRFGEVDIEQARRKPKGPVIPSAFSRDYNRFDDGVKIDQHRRKPVMPDYYGARQQPVYPARYYDESLNDYFRTAEADQLVHSLPDKRKPYPTYFPDHKMAWGTGVKHGRLNLGREQQENFLFRQGIESPDYKPSEFMMQRQDSLED